MKVNIGLSEEATLAVASKMNMVLADEMVLANKTRNYHWNVVGPTFMELHKFLDEQYDELNEIIDEVAERIKAIGCYPQGTFAQTLVATSLTEQPDNHAAFSQLTDLKDSHELVIRNLRGLIGVLSDELKDWGTADFLTGLILKHEKMAWFIRSYLA